MCWEAGSSIGQRIGMRMHPNVYSCFTWIPCCTSQNTKEQQTETESKHVSTSSLVLTYYCHDK